MSINSQRLNMCALGKSFTAMVLILGVSACSGAGGLVMPQLGPINYADVKVPISLQKGWPSDLTQALDAALLDAQKLDEDLVQAMQRNDMYSFATGLGLFTAGIVTLAFGVFDASRTLLLAGGVTTASLAGVRTFYPFQARNELYSKGRTALQCAVQATRAGIALGAAGPTGGGITLSQTLDNAEQAALDLQAATAAVATTPQSDNVRLEVNRALFVPSAEQNASDLLAAVSAGRTVETQLQPELQVSFLQNAITKIHAIVDAEADRLQPNPDEALKQARGQLTANLTSIKGSALEARDLAKQVDNNRARTGTITAKDTGAPTKVETEAKDAVNNAVKEAGQLQAKMQTIDAKLSNIDACISALDGSGA